jgi:hypothetical protein
MEAVDKIKRGERGANGVVHRPRPDHRRHRIAADPQ